MDLGAVQRFGGFVAKYMGDGVLVYFGYPQAHEDDAERAVWAGLQLIPAVGGLKPGAPSALGGVLRGLRDCSGSVGWRPNGKAAYRGDFGWRRDADILSA